MTRTVLALYAVAAARARATAGPRACGTCPIGCDAHCARRVAQLTAVAFAILTFQAVAGYLPTRRTY